VDTEATVEDTEADMEDTAQYGVDTEATTADGPPPPSTVLTHG